MNSKKTKYVKFTTVQARENFSEVMNRAAYGNKGIVLTRRQKPLCAVVSMREFMEYMAWKDNQEKKAA